LGALWKPVAGSKYRDVSNLSVLLAIYIYVVNVFYIF
jgi:hypothetical protein